MAAAAAVAGLGAPGRLPGVDLARGLAVIGMLAAHLVALPEWDWGDPATWGAIASGRSSILFATLAGVSIALVSGGARPLPRGPLRARARFRLGLRAALVWLIGIVLVATGVPVYVILPAYALLFLLALPLLGLGARALWTIAGILALVMPWLQPALDALPVWREPWGGDLSLALGWHYPFPVWIAFVVAGLAAGRSDLARAATPVTLAVAGAALAVVGYGGAALAGSPASTYLAEVLTAAPHSSGLFEVLGSGGFALAAIGVCTLGCRSRAVSAAVLPLRAVGSMPLTAYVGQIVAWAIIAAAVLGDTGDLAGMRALHLFWPFVLVTVAACTAWALLLGRGPIEWAIALATRPVGEGPAAGALRSRR